MYIPLQLKLVITQPLLMLAFDMSGAMELISVSKVASIFIENMSSLTCAGHN